MKKLITILFVCLLAFHGKAQTLIHTFNLSDAGTISTINDRSDTTDFSPLQTISNDGVDWFLFRDRLNGLGISGGKLTSTIQDGYESPDGFPRAEIGIANYDFILDTTVTYEFEWKGYFPDETNYLTDWAGTSYSWYNILCIFQIHGEVEVPNPFGFYLYSDNSIKMRDYYDGNDIYTPVSTFSALQGSEHTIHVFYREGASYPGQTAFIRVTIDGTQVYYRNSGTVGSASFDDYCKFAGLYDWSNAMVNGAASTHNRKFQLVTDAFNIYDATSETVSPPTVTTSGDQTLTLPTNSTTVYSTGVAGSGHTITGYNWTDLTGSGTLSFTDHTAQNPDITGLSEGTHTVQVEVTDDASQTATATLDLFVNPPVYNGDKWLITHKHTIYIGY